MIIPWIMWKRKVAPPKSNQWLGHTWQQLLQANDLTLTREVSNARPIRLRRYFHLIYYHVRVIFSIQVSALPHTATRIPRGSSSCCFISTNTKWNHNKIVVVIWEIIVQKYFLSIHAFSCIVFLTCQTVLAVLATDTISLIISHVQFIFRTDF